MIDDIQRIYRLVVPGNAKKFSISRPSSINLPRGANSGDYHQQGIQKTPRGEFVVSGSAESTGYIYITNANCVIANVVRPNHGNFNHVGGIQVVTDNLVAGYERLENGSNGTSKVLFYDIHDIRAPQPLTHLTISRNTRGSTAGAVALSRFNDGWLLLVANWNAKKLDFYFCNQINLRNSSASFSTTPIGSWSKNTNGLGPGSIDQNWEAYQNINMFTQVSPHSSSLWFIGMHTNSSDGNADWADLYQMNFSSSQTIVTKKGKMHFIRNGEGPRFKYGSGYYYNQQANKFEIYACEAQLSSNNTISRCNAWS